MATMATDTDSKKPTGRKATGLVTFNACMPDAELEALDEAAAADHVSRSYAIREGVKMWLKARAKR